MMSEKVGDPGRPWETPRKEALVEAGVELF